MVAFFYSLFVENRKNYVIPQKMTRPCPLHWHPLSVGFYGFWSTQLVWDVTPETLFYHLQFQTLVSVFYHKHKTTDVTNRCLSYSLILDNLLHCSGAFWLNLVWSGVFSGWIWCWQISLGVSFHSGTSDLKICNRCRNIFFLGEIPIVAFPLSRLFLCS